MSIARTSHELPIITEDHITIRHPDGRVTVELARASEFEMQTEHRLALQRALVAVEDRLKYAKSGDLFFGNVREPERKEIIRELEAERDGCLAQIAMAQEQPSAPEHEPALAKLKRGRSR
jgi:hypothetical protein